MRQVRGGEGGQKVVGGQEMGQKGERLEVNGVSGQNSVIWVCLWQGAEPSNQ